jgi:hypothetical protein
MISERQLAKSFPGFWQELLPLLTPRFIRLFNESYVHPLKGADGFSLKPLAVGVTNDNPALVAEMGFYLAKFARQESISIADATASEDLLASAKKLATALLDHYEGETKGEAFELSNAEINEAIELASVYEDLYLRFNGECKIEFSPSIPGAGFIPLCSGDLLIGDTLFEIKTVSRNLSGKDFRQLIVYLALQASTGQRRWTSAGFFNPRMGVIAEFEVDPVLFRLSGGKTPSEVFGELVAFASSREALFDTAF